MKQNTGSLRTTLVMGIVPIAATVCMIVVPVTSSNTDDRDILQPLAQNVTVISTFVSSGNLLPENAVSEDSEITKAPVSHAALILPLSSFPSDTPFWRKLESSHFPYLEILHLSPGRDPPLFS